MWNQVDESLRQSVARVLTSLAGLLPGVVAMLLSIGVAIAVGWAVGWVVVRILRWVRFDDRLERWGGSEVSAWLPARSAANLVGRLVFWTVVLLGALVGLAALDPTLMSTMLGRLVAYLPNVFVAVVLILFGVVLAQFLSRGALISAVNLRLESARLVGVGVKWLVLLLTVTMALDHLSVGGTILKLAFGILFGGIVLTLSLAVGLGSKEMVSRSWQRQAEQRPDQTDAPVQHL
jgi:hypothetical protein